MYVVAIVGVVHVWKNKFLYILEDASTLSQLFANHFICKAEHRCDWGPSLSAHMRRLTLTLDKHFH